MTTGPQPLPDERLRDPATGENVRALLETVRALLAEESARDQSFNARGVGVAGFVAIVVSLSGTLGSEALKSGWGSPWRGIGVGLFAAALAALLASVIIVVSLVLRPQEAAGLGIEEVKRYPLPEFVYAPRVMNEGRILRGLVDALVIERARGGTKATGLRWSYRLLLIGLSCISILGFLLGLHDANLIGAKHARREHRPALRTGSRAGPGPAVRAPALTVPGAATGRSSAR